MKLKKENKGFALCNCKIYIDENKVSYTIISKEYRIKFNERIYLNWCSNWFIYKNLELDCWKEDITFAII